MRIARLVIAGSLAALACAGATSAQVTFLGPTPYTSMSDSPFNLSQLGFTFVLENFEDGTLDLAGTSFSDGAIAPGATTDSVDADDGAIDGAGTAGHSWAIPAGQSLVISFDAMALNDYPRKLGLAVTDCGAGATITTIAFGPDRQALGQQVIVVGDGNDDGATAEDRFIGVSSFGGISSIQITCDSGELEIDHLQFELPFASQVAFLQSRPYSSLADSPVLGAGAIGVDGFVVDFEGGAPAALGAALGIATVKAPGPDTDSVDGDDGAIDGLGTGGGSAYQPMGVAASIDFDAAALGGLPKHFAVVVTDVQPGPRTVRVDLYNSDLAPVGTWNYVVIGDASPNGTTADDRVLEMESVTGIGRVIVTGLDTDVELDHVQYELPVAPADPSIVAGTAPYLSIADSGFDIAMPGVDYEVVDFEGGPADPFGAVLTVSFVVPPSPFTDSVDADDGAIDGSGAGGTSGAEVRGVPVVVKFDFAALGGWPRDFGIAITDVNEGPAVVRMRAFDPLGNLSFLRHFTVIGDASGEGTTGEDTFLGIHAENGLSRVEVVCLSGNMEIDHIQYDIEFPTVVEFIDPTVYVSLEDSPFDVRNPGIDFIVLDFEDDVVEPFGAELDLNFVVGPSSATDSVDADDGAIDGNGNGGTSGAELAGIPVSLTFNAALLGALPTQFGVVITDLAPGAHTIELVAFDADGFPMAFRAYEVLGDADGNGGTAEDRFIGLNSTAPIGRVTITAIGTNIELDHIQFDRAVPPSGSIADLNDDGNVDGADLGILLGDWGGSGVGDLNDDGMVNGADLGILLGEWG